MAKVIIGIHGLGNKPPKSILEKWWRAAIEEGLNKTNKKHPFKFELVYWADIIYDTPLNENCKDKDDPYFLREKYIPSTENLVPEDHSTRKIILDFLTRQLNSIFLNEDFSLNYTFVTDTILHRYFKDLDLYYKDTCEIDEENCHVKDIIRERTAEIINKYKKDEILVIGHSMGSIIGYDVLAFDVRDMLIDTFVTLGSPLGLPIVKSKIAAERRFNHLETKQLTTPSNVIRKWYNFSDLEDKVAFNYQLGDDFGENKNRVKPEDFLVLNDYSTDGERNPHKSYGYLRTPEFSSKIIEFLELKKPSVWKQLLQKLSQRFTFIKLSFHTNHNLQNP